MLVVLDLETTGLSPRGDDILEIGAIALEPGTDLVRARFQRCLARQKADADISAYVRKMHTDNGLWAACARSELFQYQADWQLADWLVSLGATPASVILVGHSIHFDKGFIDAQLPRTSELLSHRLRDIGAFQRTCQDWGLDVPELPEMPHRALEDCEIELDGYLRLKGILRELHRRANAAA